MDNADLLKTIELLKKENEALRGDKADLEARLAKKEAELYDANKRLNEALLAISSLQEKERIERSRAFIPKGEKLEGIVVNEAEEILKGERKARKPNKGKKYAKGKFDYEKHVTETRVIEPKEKACPKCGAALVEASSKVRYVVEVVPAKIKVIKLIKKSYKCPNCNKKDNAIYYPLSDGAFGGSVLTPSLAAYILYHKYELGIPFEHLAKHISKSVGFEISKQNLANHAAKASAALSGIFSRMKSDLLGNAPKVMHSDETTLAISKKPSEDKERKKSYVYVYTSSYYDENQIRIYDFHESRSIDATAKWLADYRGYVISDNFSGYDKLKKANPNIRLQKCWAHVRRRYADIVKNLPRGKRKGSKAFRILSEISKLFSLEKGYREAKLTPAEIAERRKADMPEINGRIRDLVFGCDPHPSSKLCEAVNYTKECWDDLFAFMEDGHVEMTNNTAERAVKPFVIQRKVFQTSGSYAGAAITTKLFSIVQTAAINGVDVEKYLIYVFENIGKAPIEDLLPYSNTVKENMKKRWAENP